ncbi:DUF2730 family protein [Pseudoalteromonas sp. JC28]|uniref:DUF2730 family protein n=1 Tax=unclassified Pseudoalteromonas TaxID=194690 RepID=UPI00110BAD24|nr:MULTISPECIES: DUF2730 family protein [unclassified Pseudoalteromonas]NSY36526.1 DUF2730 family protein [Pseudoalteromonas sp. JC28]TMN39080.1 DUF2730 domain-containing protein [Pseudoalteromonas sp. S2755]
MDFVLEWWKQMLAAGVLIVGAGSIAWLRATFVSRVKHDELAQRVNAVEKTIEDLPSAEDLHDLDKRLIEVGGKIDALSPQLGDLKRVTDLLMENELRGSKKCQ